MWLLDLILYVWDKVDSFFDKIRNAFYLRIEPDRGRDIHRLWGSLLALMVWNDFITLVTKSVTFRNYSESVSMPMNIGLAVLIMTSYFVVYALFVKWFGEGVFKIARPPERLYKRPLNVRSRGKRTKLSFIMMLIGLIPLISLNVALDKALESYGVSTRGVVFFPHILMAWVYDVYWHQKKYPIAAE